MLTTHLASWLVSRALKGRTLTATFTEAPAMAPDTPTLLSWRTEIEEEVRAVGRQCLGDPYIASQLLPGTSLSTPPSPATQPLKDPVSVSLAFLPNGSLLRDSQSCSCLSPQPFPSRQGPGMSPQSYLVSWPQTRGAVSVLAATGPRRRSPILHWGPGHASWGCRGNPGCGGRVVRRHPWLQRCVWGSRVGGQGVGGNVRKGEDGCSSGVIECNVNPRAGTVIFLFLVTHKCTERSERGERKRLDREQLREGHMGRDTEGGGKRGEERQKVPNTKKMRETRRLRSCYEET